MRILPRLDVRLEFIWMISVQLRERGNKRKLQNANTIFTAGFEPPYCKVYSLWIHRLNRIEILWLLLEDKLNVHTMPTVRSIHKLRYMYSIGSTRCVLPWQHFHDTCITSILFCRLVNVILVMFLHCACVIWLKCTTTHTLLIIYMHLNLLC